MQTIISSPRQRAIEPNKPRFYFWFEDEPQYTGHEARGRIAHRLKCYRANPALYKLQRLGLHRYSVSTVSGSAVAIIAIGGPLS